MLQQKEGIRMFQCWMAVDLLLVDCLGVKQVVWVRRYGAKEAVVRMNSEVKMPQRVRVASR